ncbi:sugar ABC transporter ATP-binding protein [Paraburkholderia sp. SEWSISQ10-3 4]|uniref:sugar ABC transporter ATP-binding protein n=1 Tax=Paraburkholderia TaxID=1822464 RepID=UPI00190C0774|nr:MULTISPECIES: sugar ABC transporter ATP-binding protein [Paraburkholderia]MBK3836964.1 sugar ABC transporter ATP-binding protein [Paraburkholderia aspalathi]MCX4140391.1 sugar ABC transporter ATP-binding protein [Paraburkholderia aspalathi]MDN7173076.1 sugar ABC transporter ATP-binding protein [Paraburkholderia sp. SEWSISQ10-3 4]MDQ6502717.1 sugar ABC transporter ATP-binding protein [Paraburkholderia aspalathi]CAE6705037.1 Ribose import ATP-binding protein RbsA [Paraburkholderia aspalathi]
MSLAIRFDDIRKDFGPVRVLHGVSFDLAPGRIYGLLGENGAGKSTLMKILAGYETATSGTLLVDGHAQQFIGSRDAEAAGIVLIHQEFNLAEHLTIAQNMYLGHEKKRGWFVDDAAMRAEAARFLAQVGLEKAPDTKVRELIVAEKQMVEIAKALSRRARLLIMDEPTATLTPSETERLFTLMAKLKTDGVTIVYISHKLDEVERITDEVIVMRDGRFVARSETAGLARQQMANLMVGRDVSDMFPDKITVPADAPIALKVEGLAVPDWVEDLSFDVRAGEVLGFAGLVGAGRTEAFEALIGLRKRTAGRVEIAGRRADLKSPRDAMRHGITYLSEDRKGKGLHVNLSLQDNVTLMTLERYAHPLLDMKAGRAALTQAVHDFGIRTGDLSSRARMLSGGNQQKLALAKFLQPDPNVIVLDEPTRGVDVGAKRDIYFLIHRLAAQGRAVIVISSELIELIGLCHRVAVMRAGRLQTTLTLEHLTEEELIAHATGTH